MTLRPDFLRCNRFHYHWTTVVLGLTTTVVGSIIFYYFFSYSREAFRLVIHLMTTTSLVLTNAENSFYNVFFAALAVTVGQSLGLQIMFRNAHRTTKHKSRINRSLFFTNLEGTFWYYLFWITRTFGLVGIIYASIVLQYAIDFEKELALFFYLLPIVWFLNSWLHLYRLLRKDFFKWLLSAGAFCLVLTFVLSRFNVAPKEVIDEIGKTNSIEKRLDIELPLVETYQPAYASYTRMHFLVKTTGTKIKIIASYQSDEFEIPDTNGFLTQTLDWANYVDSGFFFNNVYVTVDRHVPLKALQDIENELARYSSNTIYYSVAAKGSPYPQDYFHENRIGFRKRLPYYCAKAKWQVDSLRAKGYSADQITWPSDHPCYSVTNWDKYNRVLIEVTENGLLLNGQKISKSQLKEILTKLVAKYGDKIVVFFRPGENIDFGRYIETMDILYQSFIINRQRFARDTLGSKYDYYDEFFDPNFSLNKDLELSARKFPISVIELTGWNKELYDFLKK